MHDAFFIEKNQLWDKLFLYIILLERVLEMFILWYCCIVFAVHAGVNVSPFAKNVTWGSG